MSEFEIIFFAGIAIFFGYKLWSVLGNHTSEDTTKSAELHALLEKQIQERAVAKTADKPVLELNSPEEDEDLPAHLAKDIAKIRKDDPAFDLKKFSDGAVGAFEIVIENFAKGKKDALKFLLSKEIYKDFEAEIKAREKKDLKASSSVISVEEPEILDIELSGSIAQVVVRFVSEQINFIKDKADKIIEGSKSQIEHVTDIWTFERDLKSGKPNWVVVSTQSV